MEVYIAGKGIISAIGLNVGETLHALVAHVGVGSGQFLRENF